MPSPKMLDLLRQWQSGKKINRRQYAELVNDGLLVELDAAKDTYAITEHGRTVLRQAKLDLN